MAEGMPTYPVRWADEFGNPVELMLLEAFLVEGLARITGLPERTARRVLNDVTDLGLLASSTPKGPVSLRFPESALE
jgi:hypothetical protein